MNSLRMDCSICHGPRPVGYEIQAVGGSRWVRFWLWVTKSALKKFRFPLLSRSHLVSLLRAEYKQFRNWPSNIHDQSLWMIVIFSYREVLLCTRNW